MKDFLKNLLDRFALTFRKEQYGPKVFCIGYNKTGTTTLGKSLEMLGYRNSSFNPRVHNEYFQKGKIDKVLQYAAKFESFDDLPWLHPNLIPKLDKTFPGSKFVYLERDERSWKRSYREWYFLQRGEYPDEERGYHNYLVHQQFVLKYFAGREQDLICLEIKDPQGFRKLAEFLGKPVIRDDFPHFNRTSEMKKRKAQNV
ncbi:MAG: hypothetical protein EA392_07245 [Cryomorphaceae bacterium]|nr:MAG: hypothetical protein EA392_07245 [Cryomorphaceae bacterium]